VREQRALGARIERFARGQEMPRQRQDVVRALRQRRQAQFDRVQPVEQVFAEAPGGDQRLQVGIGRADDAHFHAAFAIAAQPLEAAGLQDAQELDLAGQRQRADFVEEQRAAIGRLELAFARALAPV
jgi:hypothetical protein